MANTTTQRANRYGLDLEFFAYGADLDTAEPLLTLDFANSCELSLDGDKVWATGYQDHSNKIGFCNAMSGTLTVSTQIMTSQLLTLMAGKSLSSQSNVIIFSSLPTAGMTYYTVRGKTIWQEADGTTHSETITFFKVAPQVGVNISYSGDGDPTSADVLFDILPLSNGRVMKTVIDYPSYQLIDSNSYDIVDSNGFAIYAPDKTEE